jgi:adenosylmethionine-8-amino-7-oxononanoate aminotransferase
MHPLAALDHKYIWHPFTQMREWLRQEPIVIVEGKGAELIDVKGRRYLDANSSIWTNLHGHRNQKINTAVRKQLDRVAHSSALGFANEPASMLAEKIVKAAVSDGQRSKKKPSLSKIFFSDDGSTAMEVALKQAYEFARRARDQRKPRFLSLGGAYHGDTIGSVALGHIDLFHKNFSGLLFKSDSTPAPYCYRCPFNRAKPERADARLTRKCDWECISKLDRKLKSRRKSAPYAGFVFEPLIQGAAGMIAQPDGWLKRATDLARDFGALLIADEVMTGFGRTGTGDGTRQNRLFACQKEDVHPDFLACAKGLTGGYLPMAATLTTQEVFDSFLAEYKEFKTFFHGHSFTGNQLGAAAALASMDILASPESIDARRNLEKVLARELNTLWQLDSVGDIRQVGLIAGVELVQNWKTKQPFALVRKAGIGVCDAMARRGVLTRPIGNVIVIMPPYCTTDSQLAKIVRALRDSISEVLGDKTRAKHGFGICKRPTFL